jgi:predicted phosphodiesterase
MLAVLYDIHGNLPALDAVLGDARAAGADRWLLGGDYAAFGGWPAESVARLHELDGAQWIRGNADRELGEDGAEDGDHPIRQALLACAAQLGPGAVADLVALPERLSLVEGCFSHASPRSDVESFGPEPADGEERLLDGVVADRFVFGHTHVQFTRPGPGGVQLVNPGSVGMPTDGDHRAAYALIDEDGTLDLRRVAYDFEPAARAIGERYDDAPWTQIFATRILRARFEG